jgi:hypothetical protein
MNDEDVHPSILRFGTGRQSAARLS